MKIRQLETPALLLNRQAMQRNMDRMEEILADTGMTLYPHYKSHKCPEIARLQMEKGAGGITCAKLGEAADLCDAGISNIVIANQVVQAEKLPKLAALAQRCRLTVCVDHGENVLMLEKAMAEAGDKKLHVLVEFDVGMRRCGVESFEEFLELAGLIESQPHLIFEGIQAYAGHMSHEGDAAVRQESIARAEKQIAALKAACGENGLTAAHVCGGSTGYARNKPKDTCYTQMQCGSYLFMDRSFGPLNLEFEQALFVETTVLSVRPDRVVVDCGVKTMTMDQEPPYFPAFPQAELRFSEEHTTIFVRNSGLKPGDRLRFVPGHCCTTINLFDRIAVIDGEDVVDFWAVTSRGKAQ